MTVEIRNPEQDEVQDWFRACEASFADEIHEEDVERDRKMIPAERMLGAYDDGFIEFYYPSVVRYCLDASDSAEGHRDWRYDEFRVSERGHVIHDHEPASRTDRHQSQSRPLGAELQSVL